MELWEILVRDPSEVSLFITGAVKKDWIQADADQTFFDVYADHNIIKTPYLNVSNINIIQTYPFRKMVRSCIVSEVFRIVEHVRKQQLAPKPVFLVPGRRRIQRNARWSFQAFYGTVVKFLNSRFWIPRYCQIATPVLHKVVKSNWRVRSEMNIFRFIEDDQMEAYTTT